MLAMGSIPLVTSYESSVLVETMHVESITVFASGTDAANWLHNAHNPRWTESLEELI